MYLSRKSNAAYALATLVSALAGCAAIQPCPGCDHGNDVAADIHTVRFMTRSQGTNQLPCRNAVTRMIPPADVVTAGGHGFPDVPTMTARLHFLQGNVQAQRAVILVGGIHDNYHYFDRWVASLTAIDNLVIGWNHDHRSMNMAHSSRLLAQDLAGLNAGGVDHITLVAHSIGGLVAKGAIDELSRNGQAAGFNRLDLHAFGVPWGGFALVGIVLKVPASAAISNAFGYPMARELSPGSNYLVSLARPMPANGRMHLYVGSADHVALPVRSNTRRRYASIEAKAATVTTIDGFQHDDYSKTLALTSLVRGLHASPDCLVTGCMMMGAGEHCTDHLPIVAQGVKRHGGTTD